MRRLKLNLTRHAYRRWYQRCRHFDFDKETESLRRDKAYERYSIALGHPKSKVYRTKSGIRFVIRNHKVVTVIYNE